MQRPDVLTDVGRLRHRSVRDRTGFYLVEGVRHVFRALDAGTVERILYAEVLAPPFAQRRVRLARRDGVSVERVTPERFRALSTAEHASGLMAVVRQHWTPLAAADPAAGLCWVAVGHVRAAGNLGTVVRTCEAAGAAGLIVLDDRTDVFEPAVVRASMGSIHAVRLVRTDIAGLRSWACRCGVDVVGTSPDGDVDYAEIALDRPVVLLVGEERRGLTPAELAICTHVARIPMAGKADSLNLGVATGVVLFDLARRRRSGEGRRPALSRMRGRGVP